MSRCATIGDRIRLYRLERGWSQQKLSLRAGLSGSQVNKLEAGQAPYADTVGQLAEALGVPTDWLIHGRGATSHAPPSA